MKGLAHNPEEWIEPEKYIPERFDPRSKYYLTPKGQKRHPMSYSPFLGGKRICLGKTFAEMVSKVIGPTLLLEFDYDFVD
jgi:cytochrome P450